MGHPLTPVVAFTVVTVFAFYLRQLVLLPQCIFGISAVCVVLYESAGTGTDSAIRLVLGIFR